MFIRTESWGKGDLSWSRVMERLLFACEQLGHTTVFKSTNGYDNMDYWSEARYKKICTELGNQIFDIDITYTNPINFPKRFHKMSKLKIGRYDYESSDMPDEATAWWDYPDLVVASSEYVKKIFYMNGCPFEKLRVLHSGVDRDIYLPDLNERPKGKIRFLCIAEPHFRKQLDVLLYNFADVFQGNSDVELVVKTKIFKQGVPRQGYEQDIFPIMAGLDQKYGKRLPKIRIITKFLTQEQMAKLYQRSHVFVLPTAAEGWGMPFLEALSSGCIVIAPDHGGQKEFLNKENSCLIETGTRPARDGEQYSAGELASRKLNGIVGSPSIEDFRAIMKNVYSNYDSVFQKKSAAMEETANKFTWTAAATQLINMKK